jgi:uncharacterized protein
MRIARLLTLSVLALTTPARATPPPGKTTMAMPSETKPLDHEAEIRAWHQKRIANLTSEDGWLTLVGLHWLKEGDNSFGSAAENALHFPAGTPARMGTFTVKGDKVALAVQRGVSLTRGDQPFTGGELRSDAEGQPDVLSLGTLRFYVIRRGERFGIRVKDTESETRKKFQGIPTYPVSTAWRIEGRFEPAPTPRKLSVPTVLGTVEEMSSPGTIVFTMNGQEYRLDPVLEPGSDQFFIIFADQTNRTETYGSGRFLYAAPPTDGKVVLDFNRAYNPPCAFSSYATCPLPPPQNRLKLRVEAGEKRYADH